MHELAPDCEPTSGIPRDRGRGPRDLGHLRRSAARQLRRRRARLASTRRRTCIAARAARFWSTRGRLARARRDPSRQGYRSPSILPGSGRQVLVGRLRARRTRLSEMNAAFLLAQLQDARRDHRYDDWRSGTDVPRSLRRSRGAGSGTPPGHPRRLLATTRTCTTSSSPI